MSPLPEKKKSAEEIQRLREALAGPRRPAPPTEMPPSPSEVTDPQPPPPAARPKTVHSLKRAERAPLRVLDEPTLPAPDSTPPKPAAQPTPHHPADSQTTPLAASPIPTRRRDERELMELRRRGAIEMLQPKVNPRLLPAKPWWLALGYTGPAVAAALIWLADQPVEIGPPACASAFVAGGAIALQRPVSRHHAAFMMTIAVTVLICAAFHYFPHLLHAK